MLMRINELPTTTSNPKTTLFDHQHENNKSQILIDYFKAAQKFSIVYCKIAHHEKKRDTFYRFMHEKGFIKFCVDFNDFCGRYVREKEEITSDEIKDQTLEIESALSSYQVYLKEWNDLQKREQYRHAFNASPHLIVEEPGFPHFQNKLPSDEVIIPQYHSNLPIMGCLQVLGGVILITASLALTALSYGTLSPMSLYGIALGITLIMGGALAVSGIYQVAEAAVENVTKEEYHYAFSKA